MKEVRTFSDFLRWIEGGRLNGYKVCLEYDTLNMPLWRPDRFIDYIQCIEQQKLATGDEVTYESECDGSGSVKRVKSTVTLQRDKSSYYMYWVAKPFKYH